MGKGFVQADISTIIEKLAKDVKFLQPVYEAITNSLEAGAKNITLAFSKDLAITGELSKITGFSITDDGEGFTKKNRDAFVVLWTKNKLKLGCKGSGRFTWLSVFEKINIKSQVKSENKEVCIPFSLDFDADKDISIKDKQIETTETTITFSDVTKDFYRVPSGNEKVVDKRCNADLSFVKTAIIEYLLIRLFLLKKNKKPFNIILKMDSQIEKITFEDIPDLSEKKFSIYSDITKQEYEFTLYYKFNKDGANSKKVYYCVNNRATKQLDDDSLGFSCGLPNKDSFVMLLCSDYFNDKDNDTRDDLVALSHLKQATFDVPLLYSDINPEMKRNMYEIILENYPEIHQINEQEEEKAIATAPHLTPFIRQDNDIVKSESSLITKANESFNKAKKKAQDNFKRILSAKTISDADFNSAVGQLSLIAVAELGEYILYRNSIIKALDEAIIDESKKEKFIHDIFMPQGTVINNTDGKADYKMSNMWLLDDKFMTFSNAFSDVSIKTIIETIFKDSTISADDIGMNSKKPDLAVFYNKDISRDALVVEFKSFNATLGEKEKSIAEISRNCYLLKEKIKEINTIWAYIITTIDDEFEISLRANGYKPRYTNANDGKILYFYNEGVAHIYALDIKAITADAFARNKTFLDILKSN